MFVEACEMQAGVMAGAALTSASEVHRPCAASRYSGLIQRYGTVRILLAYWARPLKTPAQPMFSHQNTKRYIHHDNSIKIFLRLDLGPTLAGNRIIDRNRLVLPPRRLATCRRRVLPMIC